MKKLIELLEGAEIEVTDDLRDEIENIWPYEVDTADLFTQDDVNEIIQKRLARESKLHEQELAELKSEFEGLVEPEKVQEYKNKVEELESKAEERELALKKEYELMLAAADAGVTDHEYFDYLAEKRGFRDRMALNDEGNLVITDSEGRIITDDKGEMFGPDKLVAELKEEKPEVFADSAEKKKTIGETNPPTADNMDEDKARRTRELAAEMGYKIKKEGE